MRQREAKGGSHALESTDAWENRQQLVAFVSVASHRQAVDEALPGR